ncbi:hypothetical protein BJ322DRAFT_634053 [Thelephora terrestris]|uniref:Uncharacterized protein n=1 Tax=Thelephora terrestris TaxID=56493 RepID=A0A9P6HJA6_9AGAM|nr:hypothetical protein BJ322DRAFT_634053 [Thelephora terrestris]
MNGITRIVPCIVEEALDVVFPNEARVVDLRSPPMRELPLKADRSPCCFTPSFSILIAPHSDISSASLPGILYPIQGLNPFPSRRTPSSSAGAYQRTISFFLDSMLPLPLRKHGNRSRTMIISRPSRVRMDSGDQSSLPVRTDNNFLLLALWPWKSRGKRREPIPSRSIVDAAHSLPPVALPAAPPSFSPATTIPVVTTHTRSFLPFDELDPASSSQSVETTPVSSNTLPPRSTPPAIYLAETGTVISRFHHQR